MTDISEKAARLRGRTREVYNMLRVMSDSSFAHVAASDDGEILLGRIVGVLGDLLDHIESTKPIDEARAQFKAEMDALVRMADVSPYHNEGSRETARAMRDAAVASFDAILRASRES